MSDRLKNNKRESLLFLAVVILSMAPVLFHKYYPTMDGAAHLYNAHIINQLLFNAGSVYESFFSLNTLPVPNWSGHFVLAFFKLFLPAFLAEKILMVGYLLGLAYAFRGLIKTLRSENVSLSYLVLPFLYSFPFILGFYNFSLALVLMLFTLNFWLRNSQSLHLKKLLVLGLLLLLTYFSHVFVFAILLFILGLQIVFVAFQQSLGENIQFTKAAGQALKRIGQVLLAAAIPLILFAFYFNSIHGDSSYSFLEKRELISWIKRLKPLISYNGPIEEAFTVKIFYVLCVLLIIGSYERINAFVDRFRAGKKLSSAFRSALTSADFWAITAFILLVLFLVLPDSDSKAGFFSVRLGLLFLLFFSLWLALQKYRSWLKYTAVLVMLTCHFAMVAYYFKVVRDLNRIALQCEEAATHIEEGATVYPVNHHVNWLVGHFSNYMAVDKSIVILENYEAGTGYFPVVWNGETLPQNLLAGMPHPELSCKYWPGNPANPPHDIDYVFLLGKFPSEPDACQQKFIGQVNEGYELVFQNDECRLFQLRSSSL